MRIALTLATLTISSIAPPHSPLEHHDRLVTPPPAARTISTLSYLETYSATGTVKVYRGVPADITVQGHLVDLATGVEVRTASGAATTDLTVFTSTRKGGDNSSIVIGVSTGPNTPLGTYQILLHYLVETAGPDKFQIRVFDHGTINSISIVEPPEVTGTYFTGKTYTLRAFGDNVDNAALFVAKTGIPGLTVVPQTKTGTPSELAKSIFIRFASGGAFRFDANDFFDQNLPSPPPTSCIDQCYAGNGTLSVTVTAVPVIASVTPNTPAVGSAVTIAGSSMSSPGFASQIRARTRYGSASSSVLANTTLSGSNLTFIADANMRQDSIVLEYHASGTSQSLSAFSFRLPNVAVQGGAPVITQLDSLTRNGVTRFVVTGGVRTIIGKFLAPNTLLPGFTLAVDPSQIQPISTSPLNVTLAGSTPPPVPTMKFGQNDLVVRSARYFPTAVRPRSELGADSVIFEMFNFTDTVSKTLVVQTPFGSASVANVLAVPPPTIAFIRRKFTNGQTAVVSDNVLIKGQTYEIGGVALILAASGSVLQSATIKLNGQPVTPQIVSAAAGSTLTFTVPSTATSGTLTLETFAGTVSRAVTLQDPAAPVSIVGFQASPTDVVGGQPVTATVAFNAAIATGTSAGTLLLTQSAAAPNPIVLPGTVSIRANPTVFQIPTKVTRTAVTSTVTISNVEAGTNAPTATATVTVRPPSPTGISLNTANVVGGQTVTATVQMNTSAVPADSILITLTTDDPTTVTIPASVLLNGASATIQIPTRVVPTTRTVTISAAFGGVTRSTTLTVAPPTISTVVANPTSTVSPSTVPVTVTLTASLPAAATATVACTGQGLTCPASVSLTGSSTTFDVTTADVPTARAGTITVTFNGVATSGTLDIQPLAIQTITVSPTSVRAGASVSFTLQLNRAPTTGLTFTFTSSDPSVVPAPASTQFTAGQLTKLVTATTTAPQSTAKTVTITATATRATPFGNSTITKTATVSVNP
jgi:hypothetical protein